MQSQIYQNAVTKTKNIEQFYNIIDFKHPWPIKLANIQCEVGNYIPNFYKLCNKPMNFLLTLE